MVTESLPLPRLPMLAVSAAAHERLHLHPAHHQGAQHGHGLDNRTALVAPMPLPLQLPLHISSRREHREDPMSHRIIEKRRRDRMNNCLADLSRLIPAEYLKKGRGRVEKTEIIEMAIKHMQPVVRPIVTEHYRLGYQECMQEAMHFLVEVEGYLAKDSLCVKLISHLQKHCDRIVKGDRLNFPRTRQPGEATSSSGSNSSYGPTTSGGGSAGGGGGGFKSVPGTSPDETQSSPAQGHPLAHQHHGLAASMASMAASQLRDILCSSPPSPSPSHHQYHPGHGMRGHQQHYADEVHEGGPHDDRHSPHPHADHPGGNHHSYPDSHSQHSYKFKNTIKQRFSEEHGGVGISMKRMRSSSPAATTAPSHPSSQQTQASVPIFVLHAKGSFYIPLTVSYETLAPYMDVDLLSDGGSARDSGSTAGTVQPGVVLHPVTISVNFQQLVKSYLHTPPPAPPTAPIPLPLVPAPQSTPTHPLHPWARTDGAFVPMSPWELSARP
ncbi:clockwork orange-like [Frankliniella occidentalis]|nr:clockwork orange-like [Frankliniella occidentalis]